MDAGSAVGAKCLFGASVRLASTAGRDWRTNLEGFLAAACTPSIDSAKLPDPEVRGIAEELKAALEQFVAIAEDLKP